MYTLSAGDSLVLDDKVVLDFADGDFMTIEPANDTATSSKGKNGNGITVMNEQSSIMNVTLRLLSGHETDKYLNNKLIQFKNDTLSYTYIKATSTKYFSDGNGNISKKIINLTGGVVLRPAGSTSSATGNLEQAIAIYNLQFLNSDISQ